MPPSDYASYIAAILGMPHWVPHCKRIFISAVAQPSIFHHEAIMVYRRNMYRSFTLTQLTISLKDN